jgi:hypothetical protein
MDKAALLKPRMIEGTVDLDQGQIRVRSLSRHEVIDDVQKTSNRSEMETRILVLGMVEPELTEAEVDQWRQAALAGEIDMVIEKITALSGLYDGVDKEAMRSFRGQPGS